MWVQGPTYSRFLLPQRLSPHKLDKQVFYSGKCNYHDLRYDRIWKLLDNCNIVTGQSSISVNSLSNNLIARVWKYKDE